MLYYVVFISEEGCVFGVRVLDHMRARLSDYQAETGTLFNLEATPAEGTSYRLAKLDKERFPTIQSVFEEQPPEPNFADENGML